VVLDEILEANLEVELTGSGDDVLSGLGDPGLNAGVGLGETLESLDELGEIVGVLDLDGDLDDGGDAERMRKKREQVSESSNEAAREARRRDPPRTRTS